MSIAPVAHARSVAIVVASRIGSGYESTSEQGISHFVEHMLFEGTAQRPSYSRIAAEIERLGGQINAVTEPEMTLLWAKVAEPHWRTVIEVLADMTGRSLFEAREIEKERRIILDELGVLGDAPEEAVRRSIRSRLWPGHGLGREVAGGPESVARFSGDQLRAHARRMFSGSNLVVSIAGEVDPGLARAEVGKWFAGLPAGRRAAWPPFVPNGAPRPRVAIHQREAEQVYFSIAGRALGRHDPARYAMDVLCATLGEGMGSRLFTELREIRGIVYDVLASLLVAHDSGAMMIEASTDPARLDEAMGAVLAELSHCRAEGIPASDLARAREFIKGEILLSTEDTYSVAAWYAREHLLETEQLTPDDVIAKYDQVTVESVRRVARRVLTDGWAIVAASGPIQENRSLPVSFDGPTDSRG